MRSLEMAWYVILELLSPLGWWLAAAVGVAAVLLALFVASGRRPVLGLRPLAAALGVGAAAAAAAFLAIPAWTGALLADLRTWTDFAAASGMALGVGAAVALVCYPIALWLLPRRERRST